MQMLVDGQPVPVDSKVTFVFDGVEARGTIDLVVSGYGLYVDVNRLPICLIDLFPPAAYRNKPPQLVLYNGGQSDDPLAWYQLSRRKGARLQLDDSMQVVEYRKESGSKRLIPVLGLPKE